ncbi:hypothetical protein OEZ86_007659 [Tetradesmus obliquus]|nr:hypothetical protein OEZ86_007659 [Tetradesmus obliquus]
MAYEEYVRKAIITGRPYDDLPEPVRQRVTQNEWRGRVRELCIQRGEAWGGSLARSACSEQDYYEQLLATYQAWARVYPYHLSDYVCRVVRVTPFRYYSEVLFLTLKEEKSYDRIPNFTAADMLRVTGIGRNEYIALMNACKAKRLLWRVNKGIARDLLPAAPLDVKMEPWWGVQVVNVGEAEFRELTPAEAQLLRQACEPMPAGSSSSSSSSSSSVAAHPVSSFDAGLLQGLYKRGLIYLEVPVAADDRISLPPLEGFVSNKTSEAGDESVDPFEPLLYSLFLANSSRLDQARLADILGVELRQLLLVTSLAIRLGFASKLSPGSSGEEPATPGLPARAGLTSSSQAMGSQVLSVPDSTEEASGGSPVAAAAAGAAAAAAAAGGVWNGAADSGGVAVVVDAETTSYLMMGALSPGLKRHSVTLFEGGRVGGAAVMDELITELAASAAAGEFFEGDMVQLMRHIQSLGILLGVARSAAAGQGQALELLRKESLEGLDPESAAKVLSHAYTCIIPTAPLRGPSLPLSPFSPSSPTLYGPSAEADSPWLQLALYAAAAAGPLSLVFVAGQRVWRLPGQLEGCTHALLWGWAAAADGWAASPLLVEGSSLLCSLNELLARTAVLVQPLQLQLTSAVGWLRLVKLPPAGPSGSSSSRAAASAGSGWVPLSLNLGVPLFCPTLCQQLARTGVALLHQQDAAGARCSAATRAAEVQRYSNQVVGATLVLKALSQQPVDKEALDKLEIVFLHLALPRLVEWQQYHLLPTLVEYLLGRPDMNHHTCGAIFNAYALANRLDLALATWNELANRGFDIGPFGSSALIKACARARNIGAALQVFDQLLRRRVSFNAYTYNCLLQLCCSAGRMDDALAVYNLQRLETEPANLPDAFTYTALMRGVLVSGSVELTQQLFENMLEDGVAADPPLYCNFINAAGRAGNLGLARYLYQHMILSLNLAAASSSSSSSAASSPASSSEEEDQEQQQQQGSLQHPVRQQQQHSGNGRGAAAVAPNMLTMVNALLFAHAQVAGAAKGRLLQQQQQYEEEQEQELMRQQQLQQQRMREMQQAGAALQQQQQQQAPREQKAR